MSTYRHWQSKQSVTRARQLRQGCTASERFLWQLLRRKSLGVKFRRQHPVGPYVIDFYCPALKLAIELDGTVHDVEEVRQYDEMRERWLRDQDITIVRIRNEELVANPKLVERMIRERVEELGRTSGKPG